MNVQLDIRAAARQVETARDLFMILAHADSFAKLEQVSKEDETSSVDLDFGVTPNNEVLTDLSYKCQYLIDRLRELQERAAKDETIPEGTIKSEVQACSVLISYGCILNELYLKNGRDEYARVCRHICDSVIIGAISSLRRCVG